MRNLTWLCKASVTVLVMAAGLSASADKTLPNNSITSQAPAAAKPTHQKNASLTSGTMQSNASLAQTAREAAAAKLSTAGQTSPRGPLGGEVGGIANGGDECANATPVGDGVHPMDNTAATTSPEGSPCGLFGCDLWWAYTASCDGFATASTCNNGVAGFDTVLAVYDGCGGAVLGCNDDGGGCPAINCGFSGSAVTWAATAGQTYYIRVAGYNCCIGTGELVLSCTPGGGGDCTLSGANCQGPLNNANAYNSTTGFFVAADDFTASGTISNLCWWGTEYPTPAVNDFTVTYYDSINNLPGNIICGPFSQSGGTLTGVTAALTGGIIAGIAPESEYSASHAGCTVSGDCYWVEIVNNTGGGTFWYWENAFGGNNRFAQNGAAVLNVTDLAFCLNVNLGDPNNCLPPVGSVCELPDENCHAQNNANAYNSTIGQFIAQDDFRFDPRDGCCAGDVNGDGLVNNFDIDPFVDAVVNGTYSCEADTNCDGLVNNFDIDPFVDAVVNGVCAPCSGGGGGDQKTLNNLCWWGTYLPGELNDSFTVTYYDNAGAGPGNIICGPYSQGAGTLAVNRIATGGLIAGFVPEYEYTGAHDDCVVNKGECYWLEIVNDTFGAGSWYWENGFGGNNRFLQNGAPVVGVTDLAFCVDKELGDESECLPPPPAGDRCEDAIEITGEGLFSFSNEGAIQDGPSNCGAMGADIFYCWTATCDGIVRVETCGLTALDTVLAVYDGCSCFGPLLTCVDDSCGLQTRVTFNAVAGQQYLIQLGGFASQQGNGQFSITCVVTGSVCNQPSQNCLGQNLANAYNSTVGQFIAQDDFVSTGTITDICWWGTYLPNELPDSFSVTYYDDAGGFPGGVICGPFSQGGGSLTVNRIDTGNLIAGFVPEYEYSGSHPGCVVAGGCYWIEIVNDTFGAGSWYWELGTGGNNRFLQNGAPVSGVGDLRFCLNTGLGDSSVCAPPPPPGDACESAFAISGTGLFSFDNTGAAQNGPSNCGAMGSDIFYCWTAPCTGTATVSTCGLTGLDTVLSVYDGCSCFGTLLVCLDDFCGLQTEVSFPVVAGRQYLIQLGGFAGGQGSGQFSITCGGGGGGPANDDCANAEVITGTGTFPFSNVGANDDLSPCGAVGNTVWFLWTAVNSGTATVDTCGQTTVDTVLAAYDAPCGGALLTCIDDACGLQTSITFSVTAGQQYLILLGDFAGGGGEGTGTFTITN